MSLTQRLKSALPFLGEDKDKARRTAKPTTAPPASAQPIADAYAPVDSDRTLPAQINSAASNATCVATLSGHNGSLDKQYQAFLKSVDTPAASGAQAAANGSSSASPWDSVAPSRSARSPNAPDAKSPAPAHDDGLSVFLQIPGRTRDDASESVSPAPERAQGHQDPFSIGEMLAATKSASQGATTTSGTELHGSFAVVGGDAAARDAEEDEAMQNAVAAAFATVDDDDAPVPQPRVSSTPAAVAPPECPPGAVAYPQYAAAPAGYVAAAPAPVYWVQAAAPAAPAVAAAPAASRAPPSYQAHQKAQGPSYGGYTPVTSGRLKDEKEDRKEPKEKKHSGPTTAPTKSTFASQPPPKPSFRKPEPKPIAATHSTEETTSDHAASITDKKIPDAGTAVETKAAGVDTHSKTDVVKEEKVAEARGITITQAAPATEAPKHDERATEGTALPGGVVPPGYILVPASQMEGKPAPPSKDSEDDESKAQPVQPTPSAAPAPPVAGAAAPHPYAHMQHMPHMQMMPVAPAAYAQPSYIPMMTATGQTVLVPAAPVPPQPTPGAPAGYAMVPVPVAPGAPLPAGAVSYTPSAHQQPAQPPAASAAEKMPPPPYTFGASKPPSVAPPPPAPPAHGPLPQEYLDAQRRVGEKKYAELQKRQAGEAVDDNDRVMPMSTDAGPRQLIINYLPDPVTEEELEAMFEIYGEIEVVRVIYNRATGRTKGYGFVYFAKSKDAAVAVAKLNGLALFGKRLKVAFADEQREE